MKRQEEKTEKRQEWSAFAGGHPVLRLEGATQVIVRKIREADPVFRLVGATLVIALSLTAGAEWPMEDRRPLMSA